MGTAIITARSNTNSPVIQSPLFPNTTLLECLEDNLADKNRSITGITQPASIPKTLRTCASSPHTSSKTENVSLIAPVHVYEAYNTGMHKSTWHEIKLLGQGSFSKVVLACPADTYLKEEYRGHALDFKVAIKIVDISRTEKNSREGLEYAIKREIDILKTIQHPLLIRMYEFNMDKNTALMVLPYCKGGDLFDFISNYKDKLTVAMASRIFGDVVRAVSFLHNNNIVHRDIKLENVLLNVSAKEIFDIQNYKNHPRSIATLTDFGLSQRIEPKEPLLTTRCGSEDYVSPELLMGHPYDGRQSDSWALGVVLYAMMEGRLPFDPVTNNSTRRTPNRTAHRIARVEWAWYNHKESHILSDEVNSWTGAKKIVEGCLQKRETRLLASEIRKMPWVQLDIDQESEYPWPFDISQIFK